MVHRGLGLRLDRIVLHRRIFKKDLSGLGENEALLGKDHVHVHEVSSEVDRSSQDDGAETSTLRSGMSGRYEGDEFTYKDADLGMMSPSILNREGYYWSSAKKGRGKDGEAMDLDQALGIIQQEEEHVSSTGLSISLAVYLTRRVLAGNPGGRISRRYD